MEYNRNNILEKRDYLRKIQKENYTNFEIIFHYLNNHKNISISDYFLKQFPEGCSSDMLLIFTKFKEK
jgi:hypothetical protein